VEGYNKSNKICEGYFPIFKALLQEHSQVLRGGNNNAEDWKINEQMLGLLCLPT
jgi:hypothetical protein